MTDSKKHKLKILVNICALIGIISLMVLGIYHCVYEMFLCGVIIFILIYSKSSNVLWAAIYTIVTAVVVTITMHLTIPDFDWNKLYQKSWLFGLYFVVLIHMFQSLSESESE